MKSSSAEIFRLARTLPTTRPGPTPRRWINDSTQTDTIAVIVCGDSVAVIGPSGSDASAWSLPTPGMKRERYSARNSALAAMAPENPATNDVQPVRNAATRPKPAWR